MTTPERQQQLPGWLAGLAEHAHEADSAPDWPSASLKLVQQGGALEWGIPVEFGGQGLDRVAHLEANERLASACLTTALILSQREAAVRWLVDSQGSIAPHYLPGLARGEVFTTVGLSQLTTSRQHRSPSLVARPVGSADRPTAYCLEGEIPWVTGADRADLLVTGATLPDARQLVLLVPTNQPGIGVGTPLTLVALAGSRTALVRCNGIQIPADHVLAGPGHTLVRSGGGLDTSCLALGLAGAAVGYLRTECGKRAYLEQGVTQLESSLVAARARLHALARTSAPDAGEVLSLRVDCTQLVLRATQATLAVAKGTGFVAPHPVRRRVRQAFFFLVWSCPQPVAAALFADLTALEAG